MTAIRPISCVRLQEAVDAACLQLRNPATKQELIAAFHDFTDRVAARVRSDSHPTHQSNAA